MSSQHEALSERALAEAIEQCAAEPIHQCGGIQPHGALLVVDPKTDEITHASANIGEWLDAGPDAVIGTNWQRWVHTADHLGLKTLLAAVPTGEPRTLIGTIRSGGFENASNEGPAPDAPQNLVLLTASLSGRLFLELTPVESQASPLGDNVEVFQDRVRPIFESGSLEQQHDRLVDFVRDVVGFDRVKIYRFDEAWNGQVIAESRSDRIESYMGLHFPASDIPEQARKLFAKAAVRAIADVYAAPVPLLPTCDAESPEPLDLSFCGLRATSPVHLQYLQNMGVGASLAISLMHEGRLWGLIACHHNEPKTVSTVTLQMARLISSLASSQLSLRYEAATLRRRSALSSAVTAVRKAPAVSKGFPEGIWDELRAFADAIDSAALYATLQGHIKHTDDSPLPELGPMVVDLLRRTAVDETVYSTTSLPSALPEAEPHRETACGLLAIRIGLDWTNAVLFFRPEQVEEVTWAGKLDATGGKHLTEAGSLSPRNSFDSWSERVDLTSRPFMPADIQAAADMRAGLTDIVVNESERELKRSLDELREQNAEMEEFMYSISHDLQTPVVTISGFAQNSLKAIHQSDVERAVQYLGRVQSASDQMRSIITDLLEISRIGRTEVTTELSSIREAVDQSVHDVAARYVESGPFDFRVSGEFGAAAVSPTRLEQVFDNLLTNAVKYGVTETSRRIDISGGVTESGTWVRVRDYGPGIPPKLADKAFQLFSRLTPGERQGNGVGLTIVRRIMHSLRGSVELNQAVENGAEFVLNFPTASDSPADVGVAAGTSHAVDDNDKQAL